MEQASQSNNSSRLLVSSPRGLIFEPIEIRSEGHLPGERVEITAHLTDDCQLEWISHGHFVADCKGAIDLATAPSESGSYIGLDPSGLFWSMSPDGSGDRSKLLSSNAPEHQIGRPQYPIDKPVVISLSSRGQSSQATANAVIEVRHLAVGIGVEELASGRLRGKVYRWEDRTKQRGAILVLGGSGGGIEQRFAPALASLGYDVVCLAYFAYSDLPPSLCEIPLEYFGECLAWMQGALSPKAVAVQGTSRGGELALLLASEFVEEIAGAVGVVPMFCVTPGWTSESVECSAWSLKGKALPYPPSKDSMTVADMQSLAKTPDEPIELASDFRKNLDTIDARERYGIPVEKINGPVLLISGVEDSMWPSHWACQIIANRLRKNGFSKEYRHVALRETGHLTPLPNTNTKFTHAVHHAVLNVFLSAGGNPSGSALSSHEMWSALSSYYRSLFDHA